MAKIGQRIRERREALGMTQEELSQKLGYKNKSTIAKIEKGTNDIMQKKVCEFADVLDTTVAYLMGWEDNLAQADTDVLIDLAVDLTAMEHVEKLLKLSDTSKNVVYNMIDVLHEKEEH